ncbi:MAG: hypothetical protein Q9182_003163 [Xanthomendoza sp. 2 TL-2023]
MVQQSPQAFLSSYAPRLRTYANSLLTPVIPQTAQTVPLSRTTKRGTTAINYAENEFDDDDIFEDDTGPKRLTGLRSRREDPSQGKEAPPDKFGKELTAPVNVQGIWRDWMNKPKLVRTEKQLSAQSALPLTLIPIRVDLDIPSFTPHPALPLPQDPNVDAHQARYRAPEPTPAYRLKDIFLWNLHETLITPEQFALILVQDLDLPNTAALALSVSNQIRQQLEEYAGVALHPLFHSTSAAATNGNPNKVPRTSNSQDHSSAGTPAANGANGANGHLEANETTAAVNHPSANVAATVSQPSVSDVLNPDDTYRCILTLNINLQNKLFTDKFEWSLLHPPGMAERFAKQTCADIGLTGEWVPAITHAIYEAVLRLKKEACESGGLVATYGIDNDAAHGQEAGWRYDLEQLAEEWEPKVERLSKEEIEKREGDRERQIRRLRRETARFSSTTNMERGMPMQQQQQQPQQGYFDQPADTAETPMGRGERSKKKRRFRSLSPQGRSGTPGRGTPDQGAGYGGSGGGLMEWERQSWRCSHCLVHGSAVWAVRDGPNGARTLCNNCGLIFERDKRLPPWAKNLHSMDLPIGHR